MTIERDTLRRQSSDDSTGLTRPSLAARRGRPPAQFVPAQFAWRLFLLVVSLPSGITPCGAHAVWAEDRVRIRTLQGELSERRGEVLRFDARQLELQLGSGTVTRFPSDRVVSVETPRSPAHVAADARWDQRDYAEALEGYRQAYRSERREWLRHEIVARSVICYDRLGQSSKAAELFVSLMSQDPASRFVSAIPLAWRPAELDRSWEATSRRWLNQTSRPIARLIAASWLLAGDQRESAVRALRELSRQPGSRLDCPFGRGSAMADTHRRGGTG